MPVSPPSPTTTPTPLSPAFSTALSTAQGPLSKPEGSAVKGASGIPAAGANANTGASISGRVSMSPELLAKIASGDTLFVLARAIGPSAPRMPLAVLRIPVPQKWPYAFTLTDAMAMAPGMRLSSFPEFSVEARISKSGGAVPQSGDMTSMVPGQTTPIKTGAKNLTITISRMVP